MSTDQPFEIFLVATPGLEAALLDEALQCGFAGSRLVEGGVAFDGRWPDVWRANLILRGASRVLARIGSFRALHLAQLDKRARKLDWAAVLRPDVPVRVEASCKRSRIYHAGAATQRIETAIRDALGVPLSAEAEVIVKARIENDLVTVSIDTSGEALHKRGHKEAVNKAPMRETLAALFLRQCGYSGTEPVLDPMCGSGTFVIEAAEIALGLAPGRSRRFAFEHLVPFDAAAWQALRHPAAPKPTALRFYGSDRDAGAVRMSLANAERAGVETIVSFSQQTVSALVAPKGPPGLVIVNPPYGARIGEKKALFPLYAALGQTLITQFSGWRVGVIATDKSLVAATRLPFDPPGRSVDNGGLSITLFTTGPLA